MDTISVWKYEEQPDRALNLVSSPLSKPQRAILEALSVFHYLTAKQLSRYLTLSLRYTQLHCQRLTHTGLIESILPHKQIRFGTAPYIYTLTREGRSALKRLGVLPAGRFRSLRESVHKGGPLLHTLAVNEFLLSAFQLERIEPEFSLAKFVHEREFNHDPLRVELIEREVKRTVTLSPDLWLHLLRCNGEYEYFLCVEVNLTPVEQKRWRKKVRAYLYSIPAYRARFGTDTIIVAVVINSPMDFPQRARESSLTAQERRVRDTEEASLQKRLADMKSWTELELKALGVEDMADMFRFTTVPLTDMTPSQLFLEDSFVCPFDPHALPLLPQSVEGGQLA